MIASRRAGLARAIQRVTVAARRRAAAIVRLVLVPLPGALAQPRTGRALDVTAAALGRDDRERRLAVVTAAAALHRRSRYVACRDRPHRVVTRAAIWLGAAAPPQVGEGETGLTRELLRLGGGLLGLGGGLRLVSWRRVDRLAFGLTGSTHRGGRNCGQQARSQR